MAKITLDDITSSYASTSLFQANFTAIETELNDKVLYRVNPMGEANQMENDLDLNSNDILNGGTLNTNRLVVNGIESSAGAITTTTFRTVEWTNQIGNDTFTIPYIPHLLSVSYNGVQLSINDYVANNGSTVILNTPVAANADIIAIQVYQGFTVADAMLGANNLADVDNVSSSQINLNVYDRSQTYTIAEAMESGAINNNLLYNSTFAVNQRAVSGTVVLAAGEYGHDRWQAGSGGCTYNVLTTTSGPNTINIQAGSLQQTIESGSEVGDLTLSWTGDATANLIRGGIVNPLTNPGTYTVPNNSLDITIEFLVGLVSNPKLEYGTIATTWHPEKYDFEETRCKYFYEEYTYPNGAVIGTGQAIAAGEALYSARYLPKRIKPTVTFPGVTAVGSSTGTGLTLSTLTVVEEEYNIVTYTATTAGSVTAGNASQHLSQSGVSIRVDAEIYP